MAKRAILFIFVSVMAGCSANFYKFPSQIRLAVYDKGCLDVQYAAIADGAPVQFYACGDGKRSQEWLITPAESTSEVQIMNENSQMCMAVSIDPASGGISQPGQKVIQETCEPIGTTPSQMWHIIPATNGTPGEQIVNAASGQCLDLPYGAIASIFLMQQYTCTAGDPAQGWTITPVHLGSTP